MLFHGFLPELQNKSLEPLTRVAAAVETCSSPLQNFLISSRYLSFHSAHLPPGKEPSWYAPPASHGSAIIFVLLSTASSEIAFSRGGNFNTIPCWLLPRIEPRSNLNPSM